MKNSKSKLKHRLLTKIQMNFYALRNCTKFAIEKNTVGSFYKRNKFKPCLTKHLLNLCKLWCEWGIGLSQVKYMSKISCIIPYNHGRGKKIVNRAHCILRKQQDSMSSINIHA